MQKITYNKLVRDGIPAHLDELGKAYEVRAMSSDDEFAAALLKKVGEEAAEVQDAKDRDELVKELADLAEVIRALCELKGITEEEVEKIRQERVEKRGAFAKRLFMTWGEAD